MTIWHRSRKDPPHDNCDWVQIHVYLRRVSDGLERCYITDGLLEDDDDTLRTFIWEEGNFSCDCNRYLFFQRAVDEPEVESDEQCGDGGYIVWIVNPVDGKVVYDER